MIFGVGSLKNNWIELEIEKILAVRSSESGYLQTSRLLTLYKHCSIFTMIGNTVKAISEKSFLYFLQVYINVIKHF